MAADLDIEGRDVELSLLRPLNPREIDLAKNTGFRKILASIKAIGLIEPLCVYRENGCYHILDGYLRFKACEELGVEIVPCIVYKDKQAYVYNRNVNRLSAFQEMRMLRKATESIPEPEIAGALGLRSIRHRFSPVLLKQLHPKVVETFKEDRITRPVANEFAFVKPERQAEILAEMARVGDYSIAFCRSLVLKTPPDLKNPNRTYRVHTWADDDQRRKDLVARLEKAEKQHDFYASLYRQYSTDLMKISFYIRKLIADAEVAKYLADHHPEELKKFRETVTEGEAA